MNLFELSWRRATTWLATLWLCGTGAAWPQALPRQADWQFALNARGAAVSVAELQADSPAMLAGLRNGDRVLALDAQPVHTGLDVFRARRRSKAGQELLVEVDRGGQSIPIRFRPRPLPSEQHPGIEVRHEAARSSAGFDVHMLVTRPVSADKGADKGAATGTATGAATGTAKRPAIVFIPWLSCDAVEVPSGAEDGWSRMLLDLVRESGWVVIRVEKAGLGDSTGPACVDADLQADLAGFRAALSAAAKLPDIDAGRIVLFGGSIGAALAPVLARETALAGIVVSGGFYKTWLEHMLEFERNRLSHAGRTPGEVNDALRGFAEFQALYLNGRLTPGEVQARRPDLAALWSDSPTHQYGRPARYFHQLQSLNVAAAWDTVQVPVLVVYGEYDWIMSLDDQRRIVEAVNRRHPGHARLLVVPRMNHHFEVFDSPAAAFAEEGGRYTPEPVREVMRWMRQVLR